MPTLVCPTQNDRPLATGYTPGERRFWGHFGLQPTGMTLIRESGVWSAITYPTQARLDAADQIRDPGGNLVRAYFLGGHIHSITSSIASEITAANLGATIT